MFIDGSVNVGENSVVVVNRTETGSNYSLKYGSLTTRSGSKMYIYKDVYKQNGGDNHLGGEFYTVAVAYPMNPRAAACPAEPQGEEACNE